jgi:hypothetical protein
MCSEPIKFAAFDGGPCIDDVLLEETTATEYGFWLVLSRMKTIGIITTLSDIAAKHLAIGARERRDLSVPALFTVRKEHDIV